MNFLEAVQEMKKGKKVRRPSMSPCIYLIEEEGWPRWKGILNDEGGRDISFELMEATDWEVVAVNLSDKVFDRRGQAVYKERHLKSALKEFIEWCESIPNLKKEAPPFRSKAKEIFGERLIE